MCGGGRHRQNPGVIVEPQPGRRLRAFALISRSMRSSSLAPWLVIALLGGVVVGALTLAGQRVLPGTFNQLANSGAVWSVAAFAAGRFLPVRIRPAAVVGALTLVGAVVGYYASTTVFLHDDVDTATIRAPLVWLAIAVVAGPPVGVAGMLVRTDRRIWIRAVASDLIGAVFIGEAIYQAAVNHHGAVATMLAVIGVLLPLLFAHSWSDRRRAAIAWAPVCLAGVAAVGAVYAIANTMLS
jgi:hypothetical protein